MAHICQELQQAPGYIVSMNTSRKGAHLFGFHSSAIARNPLITKSNCATSRWCKARRQEALEQWKRVHWSEEWRFPQYHSNGRIWHLPGERLLPAFIVPTITFRGGGIMLCVKFSWFGLGPFVISSIPTSTALFSTTEAFYFVAVLGVGPILFSRWQRQSCCCDAHHGFCMMIMGLIEWTGLERRPEPKRKPLEWVGSPYWVRLLSKISQETHLSYLSHMEKYH